MSLHQKKLKEGDVKNNANVYYFLQQLSVSIVICLIKFIFFAEKKRD